MHIVHIIDSLGRGGAEMLLVGIVNGLPEHQHTVITLYDVDDLKGEFKNAEIISLKAPRLWQLPLAVMRLKKQLRKLDPDIVHSHLYWSNAVARLSVKKGTKFFYSNHAVQSYAAFRNKKLIWLERKLYRPWHYLISVSKTVEDDYRQYINVAGKHSVLYNFVEDNYFNVVPKELPKAPVTGIAVGRLATQKNYPYLLNGVKKTNSGVKVDIYGIGPEQQKLEEKIATEKIDRVTLKFLHPRIYEVINRYHFFIMSSIFEGQPVSLLEAMAAGLPVLLSDIPVLREVAEDAGIYFDLSDDAYLSALLDDIAAGKIDLVKHADLSRKRATAIAKKEQYLQNLLNIYTNNPA